MTTAPKSLKNKKYFTAGQHISVGRHKNQDTDLIAVCQQQAIKLSLKEKKRWYEGASAQS